VLFLLFGSSGAGKSAALAALRRRCQPDLALHDFDEIGVPPGADTAWRQRANEAWIARALEYESGGRDLLLAAQTPFGELLACPSAPHLSAISACLLDCDDETRLARLRARGSHWLSAFDASLDDYVQWAAWMRGHAADPGWRLDVIRHPSTQAEMRWERLDSLPEGGWRVHRIDTSDLGVEAVAGALEDWISAERALVGTGAHPLAGWS
jgi:hypothetical protein